MSTTVQQCTVGVGWSSCGSRICRVCVMMLVFKTSVDVMMHHTYGVLSVAVLVVQ